MLKHWLIPLASAVVLLLALGGSAPVGGTAFIDPFPVQGSYTCVEFSPLPIGTPAIQPHLRAIPAYTEDDVRRYFQAQGADSPISGLRVLFISSQEVCNRLLGESVGLPPDTLVCFVELRGTFYPNRLPPGYHPPPAPYAYDVFDAQTGNLLMFSA